LDFILSHFSDPAFPRTISTYKTQNRQVEVFDKTNAINLFECSNFIDCRINAYPTYTGFREINRQAPNFIFIDLDKSLFKTERALSLALSTTLKTIKRKIGGMPTVLWSGNGYHIYQPIDGFVLEQIHIFSKFEHASELFLRFAEQYLSNGKFDLSHNPSFRSCMIRIPGSYNSKCADKEAAEIKIIQRWDGYRPKINLLLGSFHAYLVDGRVKEQEEKEHHQIKSKIGDGRKNNNKKILWIEKLLQTPIEDFRKNAVSLILAPYLMCIKKLSYDGAFNVIKEWCNKCNTLRQLDCNFDYIIKYALKSAIRKGIPPMRLETLREKNKEVYDLLNNKK
jgi:hypothetical protein